LKVIGLFRLFFHLNTFNMKTSFIQLAAMVLCLSVSIVSLRAQESECNPPAPSAPVVHYATDAGVSLSWTAVPDAVSYTLSVQNVTQGQTWEVETTALSVLLDGALFKVGDRGRVKRKAQVSNQTCVTPYSPSVEFIICDEMVSNLIINDKQVKLAKAETALDELSISPSAMQVFPTRTSAVVQVQLSGLMPGALEISLFDLNGGMQYQEKPAGLPAEILNYTTTIDVSALSPGIYVLVVRTAAGTQTRKIVKA
jgi:hypothetical protein